MGDIEESKKSETFKETETTPPGAAPEIRSEPIENAQILLSLLFGDYGTMLTLLTEADIRKGTGFIKLGEPLPGPVSIPLASPSLDLGPPPGRLVSKTHARILNDLEVQKRVQEYESRPPEERRLQDLIIDKAIRRNHRRKSAKDREFNFFLAIRENDPNHYDFQAYLEQVTKKLESEGLWREISQESLESDLFPIDDLRDDDLNENFEPRTLVAIYNKKSLSKRKDALAELHESGLEWQDQISFDLADLPQVTTPISHNLIRRPPWSLEEKIARLLSEGSLLSELPQGMDDLFPCAYFVSKSIFSRELFIQVKFEAFARNPLQKRFRTYSFRKYQADQKILKKLSHELLKKYFLRNPEVKESVAAFAKQNGLSAIKTESLLKSIWRRFFEVEKSLTKKQRAALDAIYAEYPPLTYTEAAKLENISRDSFQDRVRGAVKKIKDAFPELAALDMNALEHLPLISRYLYNGLFCKDSANEIQPLFQIDSNAGVKKEIPIRNSKPRPNPLAPNSFAVRAWALTKTPVPDILDTEFYLGLIPEGAIRRRTGRSKFRG